MIVDEGNHWRKEKYSRFEFLVFNERLMFVGMLRGLQVKNYSISWSHTSVGSKVSSSRNVLWKSEGVSCECLDTSRPVSLQAVWSCWHMLWCVRLFSQQASASLTYSCRVTTPPPPPLLLLLEAFIWDPGAVIGHAATESLRLEFSYSWTLWRTREGPKLMFVSPHWWWWWWWSLLPGEITADPERKTWAAGLCWRSDIPQLVSSECPHVCPDGGTKGYKEKWKKASWRMKNTPPIYVSPFYRLTVRRNEERETKERKRMNERERKKEWEREWKSERERKSEREKERERKSER